MQNCRICLNLAAMIRTLVILFLWGISILFFAGTSNALAKETPDFSELKKEYISTHITKVIDPITILGKNNIIYHLTGLDVPETIQPQALKAITELLEQQDVKLYQTKQADLGRMNRMGHSLVHMQLSHGKNDGVWVQGYMLKNGLARALVTPSNPEMVLQLYQTEEKARAAKTGLWADPAYSVKSPETVQDFLNSYQIIEGKIHSIAVLSNKIFINFGQNWKTDFTIGIEADTRRLLSRNNIDPQKWAGKKVRVRGWVESYNGPYIRLEHPHQIEFIEDQKTTLQPLTKTTIGIPNKNTKTNNNQTEKNNQTFKAMGYIKSPTPPEIQKPETAGNKGGDNE